MSNYSLTKSAISTERTLSTTTTQVAVSSMLNSTSSVQVIDSLVLSPSTKLLSTLSVSKEFLTKSAILTERTPSTTAIGQPTSSSSALLISQRTSSTPGVSAPLSPTTEPTERETSATERQVSFTVKFKITNRNYSEELGNSSSPIFSELKENVTKIVLELFKELRDDLEFKVEGMTFSQGSIICTFKIVTAKDPRVTVDVLKRALDEASKDLNKTGGLMFEDISVEGYEEFATEPQRGLNENKWPLWLIVLVSVCGVMILLILLMAYLVRMTV